MRRRRSCFWFFAWLAIALSALPAGATWPFVLPEQRRIEVRNPASLPRARIPETPPPPRVRARRGAELEDWQMLPRQDEHWQLSLDEAIRLALENSDVVRVLAGAGATSSGRTIYDPAIANTLIDVERAVFDPVADANNLFPRTETPLGAVLGPPRIFGTRVDGYVLDAGVAKNTILGGQARLRVNSDGGLTHFNPLAPPPLLNPRNRSSLELSLTQPLLRGAGVDVNLVPIMLARIDTERSFFQLKDAVQELVRSVADAYWSLVAARTELWAREQQVDITTYFTKRVAAQFRIGAVGTDISVLAQARTTLGRLQSGLLSAQNNVLQREAALYSLMGLPPTPGPEIVPTTTPQDERLLMVWDELLRLAEEQRPDVIELKLVLEADQQQLLLANNQARPQLDAMGLYRWNGLEGELPSGARLASRGEFADWTLGVNFSVPLGLRAGRARLRRFDLVIARDRANLNQGVLDAVQELAGSIRNIDLTFEQYDLLRKARQAAALNLDRQLADYYSGRNDIFLNVRQAIADWGDVISAEALALTQYNTSLITLERQTGTILESHGVRFFEERFGSLGPLPASTRCYPRAMYPTDNLERHPGGTQPSEQYFNLRELQYRVPPGQRVPLPPIERLPPLPAELPDEVIIPSPLPTPPTR